MSTKPARGEKGRRGRRGGRGERCDKQCLIGLNTDKGSFVNQSINIAIT